jgi:hypothetical protein
MKYIIDTDKGTMEPVDPPTRPQQEALSGQLMIWRKATTSRT